MPDESLLSLRQVHLWTGLSMEMIDYLCRIDLVTPAVAGRRGRGRMREFKFSDVVFLRTISHLLESGISVKKVKSSLIILKNVFNIDSIDSLPDGFLFSDGKEVYLYNNDEIITELSRSGQMTFAFVLGVSSLKEDLRNRTPASIK